VLQAVLHLGPDLYQLVPVTQQLPLIPHRRARPPQLGKPFLQQQGQDMTRVPLVGTLPAHIAGADLGRIPYPYLMTQPLHQVEEPLAIASGLDPD